VITLLYYGTGAVALVAARKSRRTPDALLWLVIGLSVLMLGLLRQVGASQNVVSHLSAAVQTLGLYDYRRVFQVIAVCGFGLLVWFMGKWARSKSFDPSASVAAAMASMLCLASYGIARASSLHWTDIAFDHRLWRFTLGHMFQGICLAAILLPALRTSLAAENRNPRSR
jgi:hypothetical protein